MENIAEIIYKILYIINGIAHRNDYVLISVKVMDK